jgi:hypothetical protein
MEQGDEWSFAAVPSAEEVARTLSERTGWEFRVTPVERGEVAIAATNGEGGLRWAPVGGDAVRVDVHERITPYLSWQADAALVELGGIADHRLEKPPIALRQWAAMSWWERARHGGRGWLLQVAVVVVFALPMVVIGALLMTGKPRNTDPDE